MKKIFTTSITKISTLFEIAEKHGITKTELLNSVNMDPSILNSPDNRLTPELVHKLTQKAVSLTGNENFGLHQGELFTGFSNILGYVLMNCKTFGEAIDKYCRYQKISDEGTYTEIEREGNIAVIKSSVMDSAIANDKQLTDFILSCMLTYIKKLTGKNIDLIEVRFKHKAPEDTSEYKRIFNCTLLFESSMNAIVFDRRLLSLPILEPNEKLLRVFEKYAQDVLDKLIFGDTYANRVTRVIIKMLQGEAPSIKTVAQKLAMSVRNLQLKLKQEGTSYRRLLNNIRKELAISYLKDEQVSIGEITYLLGFSETSVFHRSFKRWTNHTPGWYRAL